MSQHCGLPVTFANDANAAAYGEFWVGSGRDFHSMVLFTLGTGIGCGIILGDLVDRRRAQPRRRVRPHHHRFARTTPGCAAADGADTSKPTPAPRPSSSGPRRPCDAGRASSLSSSGIAAGSELTPKLIADEAEAGDELVAGDRRRDRPLSGRRRGQPDAHRRSERRAAWAGP